MSGIFIDGFDLMTTTWNTLLKYAITYKLGFIRNDRHEHNHNRNKKVLLRERKRHTACRIAIASYAALSPDRGVPHPVLDGGIPHLVLVQGVSHPVLDGGTPSWPGQAVPQGSPHLDLGWSTPHPDLGWGTSPVQTWDGVPSQSRPGIGYPLSWTGMGHLPPQVWTDRHVWKHYLPPSFGCGR